MEQGGKRIWRRRLFKIFAGFVVLAVLAGIAAWRFPQQILTVDSGPVKADVLVVLGGRPDRAVRAAELFKEGAAPLILVSGAGDDISNKHRLEREGVPVATIVLESKSRTTRQNAEFSIPLLRQMGAKRVVLVTSWYHSRRALACFEHYAPDIKFYSRPSYSGYPINQQSAKDSGQNAGLKAERAQVWHYVEAEYAKLLGYWVCYGVCPI